MRGTAQHRELTGMNYRYRLWAHHKGAATAGLAAQYRKETCPLLIYWIARSTSRGLVPELLATFFPAMTIIAMEADDDDSYDKNALHRTPPTI